MPETIIEIHSSEEFNNLLKNYPDKIIIIDFWAVWCGPCMFFAPIFKKLHGEFRSDFIFVKVNVDENNAIAMKYGITGIPTTLFIKNNDVINQVVGAMNYEGLKKVLDDPRGLEKCREYLLSQEYNNESPLRQFINMIEG